MPPNSLCLLSLPMGEASSAREGHRVRHAGDGGQAGGRAPALDDIRRSSAKSSDVSNKPIPPLVPHVQIARPRCVHAPPLPCPCLCKRVTRVPGGVPAPWPSPMPRQANIPLMWTRAGQRQPNPRLPPHPWAAPPPHEKRPAPLRIVTPWLPCRPWPQPTAKAATRVCPPAKRFVHQFLACPPSPAAPFSPPPTLVRAHRRGA